MQKVQAEVEENTELELEEDIQRPSMPPKKEESWETEIAAGWTLPCFINHVFLPISPISLTPQSPQKKNLLPLSR